MLTLITFLSILFGDVNEENVPLVDEFDEYSDTVTNHLWFPNICFSTKIKEKMKIEF